MFLFLVHHDITENIVESGIKHHNPPPFFSSFGIGARLSIFIKCTSTSLFADGTFY